MPVIVTLLTTLRKAIWLIIIIRLVLSFLPNVDRSHPLVEFIHTITEPILAPFRAILPATRIGIDFSPMLAIFAIDLVFYLLISLVN